MATDPTGGPVTPPPGAAVLVAMVLAAAGPIAALAPRGLAPLLLGAGLLAGLTLLAGRRRLQPFRLGFAARLGGAAAVLFILYAAASVLWTPLPATAAGQALQFLGEFAAAASFGLALGQLPAEARGRAGGAQLAGCVAGVALMGGERLLGAGIVATSDRDMQAAALAVLVWPAALTLARRTRAWMVPALPVACLALDQATPSTAPSLALASGLAMLALAAVTTRGARLVLALVLIAGFAAAVPTAVVLDRVGALDATWPAPEIRQRIAVWVSAAEHVADRPLFGQGLAAARVPDRALTLLPGLPAPAPHAHDLFLQIWLELGACGALLGTTVTLALVALIGRLDRAGRRAAAALMAAALVLNATSFGDWAGWWESAELIAMVALAAAAAPRRVIAAPREEMSKP